MLFDDDLENSIAPALPIIVAKWNKEVRAVLICRAWKGVRTHWYGGHTIACCGTENCPACYVGKAPVKKYYIAAREHRGNNMAILMITPSAAEMLFVHNNPICGMLGLEICLGRAAERNTAPMTGTVLGFHPETNEFGQDRLEKVVMRIFAANAITKSV